MAMIKGYTVEVMKKSDRVIDGRYYCGSTQYHYKSKEEALNDMKSIWKNEFCILTEWAQFDGGFGDYEIEIERQNW